MTDAAMFGALGDETRRRVIDLLSERARPVHELAETFAISRPAVSRHLRVLLDAGLVTEERRGRENVYSLERKQLMLMSKWLEKYWATRMARLKQTPESTKPQMEFEL